MSRSGFLERMARAAAVSTLASSLCGIAVPVAGAQRPDERKLSFDVASIRQNRVGGDETESNAPLGPGDVYAPTGGLLSIENMPLMSLISFAYRMNSSQRDAFQAAAPAWVSHDRFNLQARTEKQDVTKDELRLMMRSLLADRFSAVVHYESHVTSVYAMLLIRPGVPGPRLRPHAGVGCSRDFKSAPPDSPASQPDTIDGGFPVVCGGLLMMDDSGPNHFHIGARDVPVTLLSNAMPSWGDLGRPVVDRTGLTGNIDFALEYDPRREASQADDGAAPELTQPDFREALRKQLGLKLEPQKQPIEVLVLDRIEHLSDN